MLDSKIYQWLVLFLFCFTSVCLAVDVTTLGNELNTSSVVENTSLVTEISNVEFASENVSSTPNDESSLPFTTIATHETEFSTNIMSTNKTIDTSTSGTIPNINLIPTTQPKKAISDVLQKWLHFENITKIFAKNTVKSLLPSLMEETSSMNISASCQRDVLKLLIGFQNIKTWAFSFIDASGKIADGMLSGTLASLGDYDQCLDIKVTNDRRGKKFGQLLFTGQYCAIDIKPPLPPKRKYYKLNEVVDELKDFASGDNIVNEAAKAAQFFHFVAMRTGICVPSSCKPSDIQQVLDIPANNTKWDIRVKSCEVKEENDYTPLIISVMTVMCFFGFLLSVGSLIELYHKNSQKKITNSFLEILVCFSIVSNFKRLVNTKSGVESMSCLHGLRFLSISWIVMAHTYLNVNYTIGRGLKNAMSFQNDFFFSAVVNASVAVDTFFFISGFLVCYVTVKLVKENKKSFNIFLYLFHRIFRLLPVYIMVIAFIFLAPILGSGPIYRETLYPQIEACNKNWWTNVLFVNNFINADKMCLPQSWYVSCDMQLYIAALFVIVPILRWPWVGLSIASLGILASIGGSMAITYINEYPPTMLFVHPDLEQRMAFWANTYFKPYSHAGPYCIGLIVGYILLVHPKLKFSLATRVIGWSTAIVTNMSVLYGVYEWNSGRDPTLIETILYSGLQRVAWTYGIAWIVINCATGQGGVVNYILSWKCWIPLGRLTYAIYLIHPIVQIAAVANVRMRGYVIHYFLVWIYFGHLMVTIGSAFAACMLVEAPFIRLEKILIGTIFKNPKTSTNGHAAMPKDSATSQDVNPEEERNGHVSRL